MLPAKKRINKNQLIKLEPAFKDYIWGGDKLIREYGKNAIMKSWLKAGSCLPMRQVIV